jgi:hypothetical protein
VVAAQGGVGFLGFHTVAKGFSTKLTCQVFPSFHFFLCFFGGFINPKPETPFLAGLLMSIGN